MTLGITEHKINMEQTRGIYSELLQMSLRGRPKAGLGKSRLQDTCRSAWSLTSSRGLCVTPAPEGMVPARLHTPKSTGLDSYQVCNS